MEKMNKFFSKVNKHSQDLYIADFTQKTQSKRRVELLSIKTHDIDVLHISNPKSIPFESVNFEENNLLDYNGQKISQCECMCSAYLKTKTKKKKWIALFELKYCTFKNARSNTQTAYNQLKTTFDYLKAQGIITLQFYHPYLIISLPQQNNTPFENFIFTQTELSNLKREEKIIVRGVNRIEIRDNYSLKV